MVNRFRIGMIRTQKVHSCGQAVKRYVRFKYNLSRIQSSSISEGSTRAEGGAHPGWMTACGRGGDAYRADTLRMGMCKRSRSRGERSPEEPPHPSFLPAMEPARAERALAALVGAGLRRRRAFPSGVWGRRRCCGRHPARSGVEEPEIRPATLRPRSTAPTQIA